MKRRRRAEALRRLPFAKAEDVQPCSRMREARRVKSLSDETRQKPSKRRPLCIRSMASMTSVMSGGVLAGGIGELLLPGMIACFASTAAQPLIRELENPHRSAARWPRPTAPPPRTADRQSAPKRCRRRSERRGAWGTGVRGPVSSSQRFGAANFQRTLSSRFWKMRDDTEEIAGGRISRRPEHAHQALSAASSRRAPSFKSTSRLDIVAQDHLSGPRRRPPPESERLRSARPREIPIALHPRLNRFL